MTRRIADDSRRTRGVAAVTAATATALGLGLGLAGCSADELPPPASFSTGEPVGAEEDGVASLRTSIKAVDATLRDAAPALETEGEVATDGLRTVDVCEFGAFSGTRAIEKLSPR